MQHSRPVFRAVVFLFVAAVTLGSCKKTNNPGSSAVTPGDSIITGSNAFNYGDSIFYLTSQTEDYIVSPVNAGRGQYTGFPEGIQIDINTGAINISASETGLRYRISFIADGSSDTLSTSIVISGVNFLDGFYKLNGKDSILTPLYNAVAGKAIPGVQGNTIFDDGLTCNAAGVKVDVNAGTINLAQTVRNGVFGNSPANNDRHEFELMYRIDDGSHKALNKLKVKLYYFDSMADITTEAYEIISSREGTILGVEPMPFFHIGTGVNDTQLRSTSVLKTQKPAKPRPPCIFIVAR